jgi:hypothetical protein
LDRHVIQSEPVAVANPALLSRRFPQENLKLDLVYFDAGGGHRSAALALQSVIAVQGYRWDVRLVNLQEILDPLDIFRKITGIRLQDIYNLLLAKGWTLGSKYLLPAMQFIIRLYHRQQVELLRAFWQQRRPELVVSLIPNLNRALYESLPDRVPFVTILTDLADYPPHFWIEQQPQYFICGTEYAVQQAYALGHPPSRVFRVSGMILRPEFYDTITCDRAEQRRCLHLDPSTPTGLVLFGGAGSNAMYFIAQQLGNAKLNVQLIFICGHNAELEQKLKRLKTRNKIAVLGFTKEIPLYMYISDFFIGKPGPGSVSEALHMRLPVIVEKNAWTLPQERFNADWVRDNGFGLVLPNFRRLEFAVRDLLERDHLEQMKRRIATLNNRAVFEVPEILAAISSRTEI